jgi:hypothetical protein
LDRARDGQLPGGGGGGRGDPAPGRQGGATVRPGRRGRRDAQQPRALRRARRPPRLRRRGSAREAAGPRHRRGGRRRHHDHQGEASQAQGRAAPRPGVPPHHLPRCVLAVALLCFFCFLTGCSASFSALQTATNLFSCARFRRGGEGDPGAAARRVCRRPARAGAGTEAAGESPPPGQQRRRRRKRARRAPLAAVAQQYLGVRKLTVSEAAS